MEMPTDNDNTDKITKESMKNARKKLHETIAAYRKLIEEMDLLPQKDRVPWLAALAEIEKSVDQAVKDERTPIRVILRQVWGRQLAVIRDNNAAAVRIYNEFERKSAEAKNQTGRRSREEQLEQQYEDLRTSIDGVVTWEEWSRRRNESESSDQPQENTSLPEPAIIMPVPGHPRASAPSDDHPVATSIMRNQHLASWPTSSTSTGNQNATQSGLSPLLPRGTGRILGASSTSDGVDSAGPSSQDMRHRRTDTVETALTNDTYFTAESHQTTATSRTAESAGTFGPGRFAHRSSRLGQYTRMGDAESQSIAPSLTGSNTSDDPLEYVDE